MKRLVAGLVVFVGLGSVSYAQSPGQFDDWKLPTTGRPAKAACRDLRALTGYDFSIDAATVVSARAGVPEFCLVQGQILPEVRFEVSLPTNWNGRLYMFGNGGLAGGAFGGESFALPARIERRENALKKGFAVTATNAGHDNAREPGASFALSHQKLVDFAYRSVHVTAVTAKSIIRTYYDAAPTRSYFNGCSAGGRQGFISAQRFPDDFDGLALGAAVSDFTGVDGLDARNRAIAAEALTPEKVKLVADRVYGKCDAVDGLKDGLIDDPRRCQFSPATDVPRCTASGGSNCLTDAEVKGFEAIYRGVVLSDGTEIFPGLPVGSETGWDGWGNTKRQLAQEFFRYLITPGSEVDWRSFDVNRDIRKVDNTAALINALEPDLGRYRARGGKIIQMWGFADPGLNPLLGINYYENVRTTMGAAATDDFFRLFMAPSVAHCGGGPGPDQADLMTALVNWVERGVAPTQVVARKRVDGTIVRTRPLCPYPMVARYKGNGSIDEAANFACTTPEPVLTPTQSRADPVAPATGEADTVRRRVP